MSRKVPITAPETSPRRSSVVANASAHFDITNPVQNFLTTGLKELVDFFCKEKKMPLIIATDINAHSQLSGNEVNRRGELAEDSL